ncbi:GDP-mannose 4,6-dehydratase [Bilophila wadsworthia]|uniref:GDP-mannose 4,6-dehydratase n=1 Tax=Bilophila wadsworthia TaxID=35833 RepID=UPI003D701D45
MDGGCSRSLFGALQSDPLYSRQSPPCSPNSPYSASKISSDHFIRAFHENCGFPTLFTNYSNSYGPR